MERFAFFGGLVSLITIVATVVRSKVTAQVVGPAGLGVFAEAQQVFTLAMTVATVAVGPALVTRLARDLRDGKSDDAGRGVGASLIFGTALGTLAVVAAWLAYPHLVSEAARRPDPELLCLAFASLLGMIGGAYSALFTAQATVRRVTLLTGLTAVAGTAFHVLFLYTTGVSGQFYAPLATALTTSAAAMWLARGSGIRVRLRWDGSFAREAFRVGAASLIAGAFMQASLTTVRITLDHVGGAAHGTMLNGQYQAALTVGSRYFAIVTSGLGMYFFPRYAAAKGAAELETEIWAAASFVLRLAPPIVLGMLAVRGPLIHLLYTDRFDGAVDILGYQLAGDIAKSVAWVYAGPLVFRGDLRAFLITESVAAASLTGLSIVLIHSFGLVGSGMAYAATYLLYMFVAAGVTSSSQRVRVKASHLWVGGLGTLAAALSEVGRHSHPRLDVLLLIVAAGWAWRGGLFRKAWLFARRAFGRFRGAPG